MRLIIPVLFFIIAYQCVASAQPPLNNEKLKEVSFDSMKISTSKQVFEDMGFEYTPVDGLSFDDALFFLPTYTVGVCTMIKSGDKNFFSLVEFIHHENELILVRPNYNHKGQRKVSYIDRIWDNLIDLAGKYEESERDNLTLDDLKKHVSFYPEEKTLKKFNADMAITYTLPVIEINDYFIVKQFGKEYTHCDVLMIQKNDLGPIFFYCFYSDEGYMNRQVYFDKLEKAIGFKK